MQHGTAPNPNGNGKRVEALVIGVIPAVSAAASLIAALCVAGAAYFSLAAKINALETQFNTMSALIVTDRWTRSDQAALCRWQERNGAGKCPETLPRNLDLKGILEELKGAMNK